MPEPTIVETPAVAQENQPVLPETEAAIKAAPKRKKIKRTVSTGQMHVLAAFNNTLVSFTDNKGNVLTNCSAGACGFRGSKKGTAYAAQIATEKAGQLAKQNFGLSKVEVYVKGIGLGRDAAIRTLQNLNIGVDSVKDVTGVPHGGVRPRKARRV
ncbi:MAG TPA: 30S ribosomal protein S11 [Patescibacteria group bacterium]|jgi:small subunit ribosomal protein S11|nr:30S ribosomal protein S11 [Patescibacteria group bacterium]